MGGPDQAGSENQVCLSSAQHCSFAVVVVAAAAYFVEVVVSTAGLDQAQGSVAAECYLLPSAGVS